MLRKVFGQQPERWLKFNRFIKWGTSLETALKAPMSRGGWLGRPLQHRGPTPVERGDMEAGDPERANRRDESCFDPGAPSITQAINLTGT